MKAWVKDAVGVLSHLPAAYLVYILGYFIWMLTQMTRARATTAHLPQGSLFLAHVLVVLLLLAFYFLWLVIGSGFTLEGKMLWAVGLVFAAPVTILILYWVYLHRIPAGSTWFGRPFRGWPWRKRETAPSDT